MGLSRIEVRTVRCRRCDFQWLPRVVDPRQCPKCHRYTWRTPRRAVRAATSAPVAVGE
jgi:predicted Zn-ribbon and HTH transcriptional regulator